MEEREKEDQSYAEPGYKEAPALIDFDLLLKSNDLESAASKIIESSYEDPDFMRRDTLDKLIDFIYFKVQTGYLYIIHMAYPTKRMIDKELEEKIIDLVNYHLYPDIVYKLLKFFTRNIDNSDSNLYIANLIYSQEIIKSIFDTYILFKNDIFITDPVERSQNVKRIQQFSSSSDEIIFSPLDSAARLKYILEFFYIKLDVSPIYTRDDLILSKFTDENTD